MLRFHCKKQLVSDDCCICQERGMFTFNISPHFFKKNQTAKLVAILWFLLVQMLQSPCALLELLLELLELSWADVLLSNRRKIFRPARSTSVNWQCRFVFAQLLLFFERSNQHCLDLLRLSLIGPVVCCVSVFASLTAKLISANVSSTCCCAHCNRIHAKFDRSTLTLFVQDVDVEEWLGNKHRW